MFAEADCLYKSKKTAVPVDCCSTADRVELADLCSIAVPAEPADLCNTADRVEPADRDNMRPAAERKGCSIHTSVTCPQDMLHGLLQQ